MLSKKLRLNALTVYLILFESLTKTIHHIFLYLTNTHYFFSCGPFNFFFKNLSCRNLNCPNLNSRAPKVKASDMICKDIANKLLEIGGLFVHLLKII